jgi:hypothetical protein
MIKIMTRLDDGIYASQGGGEVRERYHWNKTSGRNLLLAVRKLYEHRGEMATSYGSIGCGCSWIEIDGRKVKERSMLAQDIDSILDDFSMPAYAGSPTQALQALIDDIKSGEYDKKLDRRYKIMDEESKRENDEIERERELAAEERAMEN